MYDIASRMMHACMHNKKNKKPKNTHEKSQKESEIRVGIISTKTKTANG